MWFFHPIFLQKSKKLDFPWKIFRRRKFKNPDDFFPDTCPVDEHSFRRFLKYLENRAIFEFFSFFFYEARHSAVFQPMCRECMSGVNSILPVSESVPFKKQCGFLMRFLKKNRSMRPTHYAAIFLISDFCRWRCQSRHFVLRSFAWMQKK